MGFLLGLLNNSTYMGNCHLQSVPVLEDSVNRRVEKSYSFVRSKFKLFSSHDLEFLETIWV